MIRTFKISPPKREDIIAKLTSFLKDREEIIFAYLYGSFVHQATFRDVDLALYIKDVARERITDYLLGLSIEIERIVGFPVDVRSLNDAPIDYQYNVITGKVLFSKDEVLRVDFVGRVVSRYLDMAPMVKHYLKEAMT